MPAQKVIMLNFSIFAIDPNTTTAKMIFDKSYRYFAKLSFVFSIRIICMASMIPSVFSQRKKLST